MENYFQICLLNHKPKNYLQVWLLNLMNSCIKLNFINVCPVLDKILHSLLENKDSDTESLCCEIVWFFNKIKNNSECGVGMLRSNAAGRVNEYDLLKIKLFKKIVKSYVLFEDGYANIRTNLPFALGVLGKLCIHDNSSGVFIQTTIPNRYWLHRTCEDPSKEDIIKYESACAVSPYFTKKGVFKRKC